MKTTSRLLALALVAGGTMFAQTRVSIGIGVGGYAQPPAYTMRYRPPMPHPGYIWVDGYWNMHRGRQVWVNGYWRAPSKRELREMQRQMQREMRREYRDYDRRYDPRYDNRR